LRIEGAEGVEVAGDKQSDAVDRVLKIKPVSDLQADPADAAI